jgi:hypothetical protein
LVFWALEFRVGCKREILEDEKDSEVRKLVATIKFLMNINDDKREWLFGAFIGGNTAEFFISSGTKFLERLIKTIK